MKKKRPYNLDDLYDEEQLDKWANTFIKEPEFKCPNCKSELHTEWVDNGFGPYSVQASPYHCEECGWSEIGCTSCGTVQCFSWNKCMGNALKVPMTTEEMTDALINQIIKISRHEINFEEGLKQAIEEVKRIISYLVVYFGDQIEDNKEPAKTRYEFWCDVSNKLRNKKWDTLKK